MRPSDLKNQVLPESYARSPETNTLRPFHGNRYWALTNRIVRGLRYSLSLGKNFELELTEFEPVKVSSVQVPFTLAMKSRYFQVTPPAKLRGKNFALRG